jgi:4-cresol dehydrogenase (hydroxylating)
MSPFLAKEKKQEMERWLNAFYYRSVYRGNTSELSIRSLYWRKPQGVPSDDLDPNRDACGLVWLCHAVPCRADSIQKAEFITKEISIAHRFDPNVAFLVISERYVRMFVALMYDRDRVGLDARVMECQRKISDSLVAAGFPPFRLGIQSMDQQTFKEPEYHETIRKLKQVFDPQNVVAPGRYDGSLRQVC